MKLILFTILVFTIGFLKAQNNDFHKAWYHLSLVDDGVPGIGTQKLYAELEPDVGTTEVIVAVLDAGIDITHKDLQENIWINSDEIPGNGVDDDKNGYVDDINGWNFLGNENGENVHFDTWEIVREYQRLQTFFKDFDTLDIHPTYQQKYDRFKFLREDIPEQREQALTEYTQWKKAKDALYSNISLIMPYAKRDEFDIGFLKSLDIPEDDTTAMKACKTLIQWYSAGYSKQMIELKTQSLEIRYKYKLNIEYDSRGIIGDDPGNFEERHYGNPDVVGPDPFHGTSVAGIIGAVRDNDIGIDGIAKDVKIMAIRVIPAGDERDKDVANAIYYAVDNGARIINMSFGKPVSPFAFHVNKAIKYAEEHNVLLVTGSGNDGKNTDMVPRYPNRYYEDGSECNSWINVGSITKSIDTNLVAPFSSYGRKSVDLFAPGQEIITLFPDNRTIVSEGTSISAPMVSGVAALIWSYFPTLSALEIKQCILSSVMTFNELEVLRPLTEETIKFSCLTLSGGTLDLYTAFQAAKTLK